MSNEAKQSTALPNSDAAASVQLTYMNYDYIENFKKLCFGMFIHFGLYSVVGKGEWYLSTGEMSEKEYQKLACRFNVKPDWAKELVSVAKQAGCKYLTFTARHHDGFSLFDTCGLSCYDSTALCGRDFVRELADECRKQGLKLMLYHTLLDWHNPNYKNNFNNYIDYLIQSVEILCKNYGEVCGFWFDGMWDKPDADWQQDRLFGTIRKHLPNAIIVNNTGLDALGQTGHKEIDSVTFERGKPFAVKSYDDKPIAGEVCDSITDHWGFAENDISAKSAKELLDMLLDCRKYDCNLLLNSGLLPDGSVNPLDKQLFLQLGKWIHYNDDFIYRVRPAEIVAENADIFTDGKFFYAVVRNVPMALDKNVARQQDAQKVIFKNCAIASAQWSDNGCPANFDGNCLDVEPFGYGTSMFARVAKLQLCEKDV